MTGVRFVSAFSFAGKQAHNFKYNVVLWFHPAVPDPDVFAFCSDLFLIDLHFLWATTHNTPAA